MNRYIVGFLASIAFFASTSFADTYIPLHCRVSNEAPGWCLWAAIETVARAQGIKELYGLKESRKLDRDGFIETAKFKNGHWEIRKEFVPKNGGTLESVLDKFERMRFNRFRCQNYGTYDQTLLMTALRRGHGAVVQVDWEDVVQGRKITAVHAVVVTKLTDDSVEFVNSNKLRVERRSRTWFFRNWDGFTIILD